MINDLPILLFDGDAQLLGTHGAEWIFPGYPDPDAVRTCFLRILRPGDRKRFLEFCTAPFLSGSDASSCEIFPTGALSSLRFAFCEKNRIGERTLTTVFLAENIGQFRRLMSPALPGCSEITGRILRELLYLAGDAGADPLVLTPDTVFALRIFPKTLRAVTQPARGKGCCDIFRITEAVIDGLRKSPLFLQTTLSFRSPDSTDPSLRILELSAELYVHVLTSLLTALTAISADHILSLDIQPFAVFSAHAPLAADVTVTTAVRTPEDFRQTGTSLTTLAQRGSVGEILLTAATVLAYTAGLEIGVRTDPQTQKLCVSLTVNSETSRPADGFKYRDPYACVPEILAELLPLWESGSLTRQSE